MVMQLRSFLAVVRVRRRRQFFYQLLLMLVERSEALFKRG